MCLHLVEVSLSERVSNNYSRTVNSLQDKCHRPESTKFLFSDSFLLNESTLSRLPYGDRRREKDIDRLLQLKMSYLQSRNLLQKKKEFDTISSPVYSNDLVYEIYLSNYTHEQKRRSYSLQFRSLKVLWNPSRKVLKFDSIFFRSYSST